MNKEINDKGKELPLYSNWDVKYPIKLSSEQEHILIELTNIDVEYSREDQKFYDLIEQVKKNKLPPLAKLSDLEITNRYFKNISKHDVLIIVSHITGRDLAVRTHWLKPDQFVERSIMGTDLVYPNQKK